MYYNNYMPDINLESEIPSGSPSSLNDFERALYQMAIESGMVVWPAKTQSVTSLETFFNVKLADSFGVDPDDVTPELLSKWEQESEFDSRPPGVSAGDGSGFLTRREILERRIRVEEICGIDTGETKAELARRAIGTFR